MLARYGKTLVYSMIDQMAKASLDQNFKDELSAIEQWFQVLSDAERTATLYSLLQHTSRVQQGFFVAWLQQGMRKEQRGREVRKMAEVGRARRMSQNKPQLAGISAVNEQYARLVQEESRPRSALTPASGYHATSNAAHLAAAAALAHVRPKSVIDPTAYEEGSGMRAPPGLEGPPRGAKWSPMTPTFSNFAEIAKGIERPQSTNDLDRPLPHTHARGPSKLGMGGHTPATVRSPHGPSASGDGFVARARLSSGSKLGQTPPMSAGMRGVASPAFPPGLFPSNPWAAAAAAASPGYAASLMSGIGSASLDKRAAQAAAQGHSAATSAGNLPSNPNTPGAQSLKHKFANLIVENRVETAKEVTARLNGTLPVTPTSATINPNAAAAEKATKTVDPIDFKLLNDISAWFRSMRLHKYTSLFEKMKWQDIIKLTDEQLSDKGVAALGARRKMLKVFEQVKEEAAAKNISVDA